jgi:hypothetical protein
MVGRLGAGLGSFCFHLQPELDQAADGFNHEHWPQTLFGPSPLPRDCAGADMKKFGDLLLKRGESLLKQAEQPKS